MNDANEALRALDELQGTLGYLPDGPYDRATDAVEKLRAHLTAPGYVRVPVEPTEAMLDVAVSHALMVAISGDYTWTKYMRDVWARMLAAATKEQTNG